MSSPIPTATADAKDAKASATHKAEAPHDTVVKVLHTVQKTAATVEATGKHQGDVIQKSSTDAVNAYHNMCASWLERRTEDMRLGMAAAKSLSVCRDMSKAADIYSGWISESMRRLQDELSSAPKEISKLGNQYMDTFKGLAAVVPGKTEDKKIN